MQKLDTATPEQVIAVPMISLDRIPQRSAVRRPQKAEQLVEVPTIVFFSFSAAADCRADHRHSSSGSWRWWWTGGGLPDRIQQHGLWSRKLNVLPDPGASSSSEVSRDERGEGFFRTFPRVKKKSEVTRHSESEGARQVVLMDSGGLCERSGRGRVRRVPRRLVQAGLGLSSTSVTVGAKSAVTTATASCRCTGPFGSFSRGHSDLEPPRYKFMALWTVYEMACFLLSSDSCVPVNMLHKFQQSVQMTVVVPRPQFINSVGHCSHVPETGTVCNCAEDREDSSVQFFGKVVQSPLLCNDRCRVKDSAVPWRCRYCSFSTVVEIPVAAQRQVWGASCAKTVDFPRVQFSAVFRE